MVSAFKVGKCLGNAWPDVGWNGFAAQSVDGLGVLVRLDLVVPQYCSS